MTVKMIPDSIGKWFLHCHVNSHMVHGMMALYDVEGKHFFSLTCFGMDKFKFNKISNIFVTEKDRTPIPAIPTISTRGSSFSLSVDVIITIIGLFCAFLRLNE